jgi:hypothetical protein
MQDGTNATILSCETPFSAEGVQGGRLPEVLATERQPATISRWSQLDEQGPMWVVDRLAGRDVSKRSRSGQAAPTACRIGSFLEAPR